MSTARHAHQLDEVCTDPVILNQWHPLSATAELARGEIRISRLLGVPVGFGLGIRGETQAWRAAPATSDVEFAEQEIAKWEPLVTQQAHGYLWTTLGDPGGDVFTVPETSEPDRRTLNAATLGIEVSAPRAVENFLDMAHFPYVHRGVLGAEPHTEVADYKIEWRDGEIWAVGCRFYQPQAAAASESGVMAEYLYRVPHPYCAMLYKSSPGDPERLDAIGIFIHPLSEVRIRAHLFLSLLDDVNSDISIRFFQQSIFAEDKPILENQHPKRLPLDPRAETPIRADRAAITYRRWLSQLGVSYGTMPAAAAA